MKTYKVLVTSTETLAYHINAENEQEAKELVLSGDYDPYETVDCSIDDVEVADPLARR